MNGIYNEIYSLITSLIFGNNISAYEDLIAIIVSTVSVLFLISIPFIVVIKVIRILCD